MTVKDQSQPWRSVELAGSKWAGRSMWRSAAGPQWRTRRYLQRCLVLMRLQGRWKTHSSWLHKRFCWRHWEHITPPPLPDNKSRTSKIHILKAQFRIIVFTAPLQFEVSSLTFHWICDFISTVNPDGVLDVIQSYNAWWAFHSFKNNLLKKEVIVSLFKETLM